jgi:Bacterial membrane protein YfhO
VGVSPPLPASHRLRIRLAVIGGVVLLTVLCSAWFAPLFQGRSFSVVAGHQTAVFPWRAFPDGYSDRYPQSDQADLNFPWQAAIQSSVRSGSVPWWNPDSFGGQPFFSNGSSAVLYPPRLLTALTVSPATAHNIFSFLHVLAAGVFMFLFLLDLGLDPIAGLLGAVAWMFGTFMLGWVQLEVHAAPLALLPAGMLAIRRAVVRERVRWVGGAALVVAVLLISGHILFTWSALLGVFGYGICLALVRLPNDRGIRGDRAALLRLLRVPAVAALGFGSAAVVLLPTAMVLRGVSRQQFSYATLRRLFVLAPSDLQYAFHHPPLPVTQHVMHQAAFGGSLTILFALLAITARRPGAGLGRGLAVIAVLVAIGTPATWLVYQLVPGMKIYRSYARLLFLFDFAIAVLAAVGLDRWLQRLRIMDPPGRRSRRSVWTRAVRWMRTAAPILGLAVVGLSAFELGSYGRRLNPPFPPSASRFEYPATPLIRDLVEAPASTTGWPHRIIPIQWTQAEFPILFANESLVFGLDSASGYDSAVPLRTAALWRVVEGEDPATALETKLPAAFVPGFDRSAVFGGLLPRLGIDRMVITPSLGADSSSLSILGWLGWALRYRGPDGVVLQWTGSPAGPHVVYQADVVANDLQALMQFMNPGFDYQHRVILEGLATQPSVPSGTGHATISSARRWDNGARIVADSDAPGWLVVPDSWDRGWSAMVNGRRATVRRANFNQRAIAIPAGRSDVVLRYRPQGLEAGLAISGACLLACAGLLFWPVTRRYRRPEPARSLPPRPPENETKAALAVR